MADVLVAMSGGVDSSVAAARLLDEGHNVVGVTMKLWGGDSDTGCCSVSDVDDARRVAQQLGIDHVVFNFTDDFDRHVVEPYVADHGRGRTPNPCVECNRHLKFDRLLERAGLLGFDAVATGHHARVVAAGGRFRLERGADRAKDQSYVLHMLGQDALRRVRFPVGDITKDDVRRQARALGLRTALKPDSQDVCFITRAGGRADFLARRVELHPGRVVDAAGNELGRVDAVELVTVGQRRGLGADGALDRRYAVAIDVPGATVTVGEAKDLLVDRAAVESQTWVDGPVTGTVLVQCSAHGAPRPGRLAGDGTIEWEQPERRIAPGQSVVFYDVADRVVLGGGKVSAPGSRGVGTPPTPVQVDSGSQARP
jgi:tRNA-specific 2-thiouridylase